MKVSTLFLFIILVVTDFSFSLAGTTSKKVSSNSTKTTTTTTSTKLNGATSSSDCSILKEVFRGVNSTYSWYTDIMNCCKNKAEFLCTGNKVEAM